MRPLRSLSAWPFALWVGMAWLPAQATDYVVLIQNEAAGHLTVQRAADGLVQTDFSYRNNGRGPDLKESFVIGAQGVPIRYEANGVSTPGAKIGEIVRGHAADTVLIDGDPSVDITHLRRASLVIQGSVAYAPAQIYDAIGFKPFVAAAVIESTPKP